MRLYELFEDISSLEAAKKSFLSRYKSLSVGTDEEQTEILKSTYEQLAGDYNLTPDEKINFADYISATFDIHNLQEDVSNA